MTTKTFLKAMLATHPPIETAVRKRYHLPQLYRAKLLAHRLESPPYPLADWPPSNGDFEREMVERLARDLGTYVNEYMNGSLYNPPLLPALANIPADRSSEDRYERILESLESSSGSVLDIGCHIGAYFASRFDGDGFDAIAIDENVVHAHFSKRMTALRNPDVQVEWDSLYTWEGRFGPFDVVLGLNVFHHMLKERRLFNRLRRWLSEVTVSELFVQVPDSVEPMWPVAVDWMTGEEWAEFIVEIGGFDRFQNLGRPSNDRPMFHFVSA